MRSKAGKQWTAFLLALLLAMSAISAHLTAEAEGPVENAAVYQHGTEEGHNHSALGQCHQASACEGSAALQVWQQSSIIIEAGELAVVPVSLSLASLAPEAHLPPPKV
ncbi:hypothetical protein QEZ52_22825 (plasmid) [Aliisedimentitalea scapharcae]|uniref:Cobalt transporter subunit CbtB n=1 Tax=Aliisedimentitalea scapharcae TaxID=1524259 RepID=A0ABZ2Y306_9RHOB